MSTSAEHPSPVKATSETKAKTSPKADIVASLNTRERKPVQFTQEKSVTPEVTTSTKAFCGDMLFNQYINIQNELKAGGQNNTTAKEYKDFIQTFRTTYEEKTKNKFSSATEDDLHTFARSIMEEGKYQLWAVSVAESRLAVLQAVTGARVETLQKERESAYIPTIRSFTNTTSEVVTREHVSDAEFKKNPWKWFVRRNQMCFGKIKNIDRSSPAARKAQEQFEKQREQEARKPAQTLEFIEFPEGTDKRIHLDVKIEGRKLNGVELAFLKSFDQLGSNLTADAFMNASAQREVDQFMGEIALMRRNFYASYGVADVIESNVIREIPLKSGEFEYNGNPRHVLNASSDKLGLPQVMKPDGQRMDREVTVGVGNSMKLKLKTIETGLIQELKPIIEKNQNESRIKSIDKHIGRLKSQIYDADNNPIPKDAKRLKEIDEAKDEKGIKLWRERADLLQRRIDLNHGKDTAENTSNTMETNLDDTSLIKDPNNQGAFLTYRKILSDFTAARDAYNKAEAVLAPIRTEGQDKPRYDELIKREKSTKKPLNANEVTELNKLKIIFEGDVTLGKDSWAVRKAAAESVVNTTKPIYDQAQETNSPYSRYRDRIELWLRKDADSQKLYAQYQDELKELEDSLSKSNKLKKADGTEYSLDEVQAKINALDEERKVARLPDKYIEQQIKVYQELKKLTNPVLFDAIRERSRHLDGEDLAARKRALMVDMDAYQHFPVVYLQVLQMAYGPEITNPGNEEEFNKATRLITLDTVINHLNDRVTNVRYAAKNTTVLGKQTTTWQPIGTPGQPIRGRTDAQLRNTSLLAHVDSKFMSDVMTDLLKQAKSGTLGETQAAEQDMLETIGKVEGRKLEDFRDEHRTKISHAVVDVARSSVTSGEVEASLRNVAGIDQQNLKDYTKEVRDLIQQGVGSIDAVTRLVAHYQALGSPIQAAEVQLVVDRAYAALIKKYLPIEQTLRITEIGLKQGRTVEESTTLSAAYLMIRNPAERQLFLSMMEQGKTPDEIYEYYNKLAVARQPGFFKDYQELYNRIKGLPKPQLNPLTHAMSAGHSLKDFNHEIGLALVAHKRRILNVSPRKPLSKEVAKELAETIDLIHAVEKWQKDEKYISEMEKQVYIDGSVEEVTWELLKNHNESVTDVDAVSFEKMTAQEMIDRRDKRKKQKTTTTNQTPTNTQAAPTGQPTLTPQQAQQVQAVLAAQAAAGQGGQQP